MTSSSKSQRSLCRHGFRSSVHFIPKIFVRHPAHILILVPPVRLYVFSSPAAVRSLPWRLSCSLWLAADLRALFSSVYPSELASSLLGPHVACNFPAQFFRVFQASIPRSLARSALLPGAECKLYFYWPGARQYISAAAERVLWDAWRWSPIGAPLSSPLFSRSLDAVSRESFCSASHFRANS